MARISTYATSTPTGTDLLVGTDAEDSNITKNFSIQSVVDLAVAGTYLPLAGGTITGDLAVDGALALKVNSGFANISTNVTGTIFIGNSSAGVTTGLNITGDIAMQGTNASITLTSPTAAIYMTSPDGTTYKVQMANGGTFNITQL
jgi:hypothetical protein|tara:strand:- start:547 stop:984 length:438 start_codon:yes stop_codon:yes gene_type:complete